jgi:CRISPR-associated protein Cmr5
MPGSQQQQSSPARTPPIALQRAHHAMQQIQAMEALIAGTGEQERKRRLGNYVSYVEALPANILRSGLGQAMAMEKAGAKNDAGHAHLYNHIDSWLTADRANAPYRDKPGQLLREIGSNGQDPYVRAQAEALAYLEWLKKFAVAFLKEEEGSQQGGEAAEPNEQSEAPA